jgi:hypothetical protein
MMLRPLDDTAEETHPIFAPLDEVDPFLVAMATQQSAAQTLERISESLGVIAEAGMRIAQALEDYPNP